MRKLHDQIVFSASDLANHIHCKHLTNLNLDALDGIIEKSFTNNRPLILLRERGEEFEQEILSKLEATGSRIFQVNKDSSDAFGQTVKAMEEGYDYIYQARLSTKKWQGWADFLRKTDKPSKLGDWSYEVIDTKLSLNTRVGTILQIALYSELIGDLQGILPEFMYVQNPDEELKYRVTDYISYLRLIKNKLNDAIEYPVESYPEPCSHCSICDWWEHCNKVRRNDDHLSFIAGMGTSQIKEVRTQGITTLAAMAEVPLPIPFKPKRGHKETFTKLREQARIQQESRIAQKPVYEILDRKPHSGFFNLPEPSKGDIYLDFEGDPLIEPSGLEYLFGWIFQDQYYHIWVQNMEEEKAALETFVDFVFGKLEQYPDLHIYHFAPYENAALKRMIGKYAVKENEIDILLRTDTFVDLHRVLKQSIRAGVEKYSLKDLEVYHGFVREIDLRTVSGFKADFEFLIEANKVDSITDEMKEVVKQYNQDDCASTMQLHKWLERERKKLIDAGEIIERPIRREVEEPEHITAHLERIMPLYEALLEDVPADFTERTNEQQARFILAHFLDWYRREKKSFWWEYYRLRELDTEELLDEKGAIAGLNYNGEREPVARSIADTYFFPPQEMEFKTGDKLKDPESDKTIEVYDLDVKKNFLKLKKGKSIEDIHPERLLKFENISTKDKEENIISFAEWIVENGFDSALPDFRVTRDILLNSDSRLNEVLLYNNDSVQKSKDWSLKLDNSYLPIQGPPGAGKSFTASHMIIDLIKAGKKVGITALSHKVIINLLNKVKEVADKEGIELKALYKGSANDENIGFWDTPKNNGDVIASLSQYQLIAGTSFMWCLADFKDALDYLFIDEAGQYALIETTVVSHAAKNVVLLGDHQQLKQPIKGVHPEGTDVSALEHLLQGEKTIPEHRGVFLAKTWRMHPTICDFDSEMFYETRLTAVDGLQNQKIEGNTIYQGSGLFFKPVQHEGNNNTSEEEIDEIEKIVSELTKGDVFWIDEKNEKHPVTSQGIKIITPYNSNVFELQKRLPDYESGTVDKFQGQEAPIIIYSMASSTPEDAPRGMDFLYSPNRFNVAVSRARAIFILVGSPNLFEPDCHAPNQIKLANPFCRYLEVANQKPVEKVM